MSRLESLRWGKLHVYLSDDCVNVYYWVRYKMYSVKCTINKDNSLHVVNQHNVLLPATFWHALGDQSDKIITYLMLKGCK